MVKFDWLREMTLWRRATCEFENKVLTDTSEDSKRVHRRICIKVDASIFLSFFSTRPKKEKKIVASTLVQIRLWTSFESSLVSVKWLTVQAGL